ncbi:MAG: hypothetical protein LBR16_05785 [Treponema sp.]|jgi:hypothetical protein|nr:hypothetical protein [Treponema sp.]
MIPPLIKRPARSRAGCRAALTLLLSIAVSRPALTQEREDWESQFRLEVGASGLSPLIREELIKLRRVTLNPGLNFGSFWYFNKLFGLGLAFNIAYPITGESSFPLTAEFLAGPEYMFRKNRFALRVGTGFYTVLRPHKQGIVTSGDPSGTVLWDFGVGLSLGMDVHINKLLYLYCKVEGGAVFVHKIDFSVSPGIGVGFKKNRYPVKRQLD